VAVFRIGEGTRGKIALVMLVFDSHGLVSRHDARDAIRRGRSAWGKAASYSVTIDRPTGAIAIVTLAGALHHAARPDRLVAK
jgi:hypothetical protein